MKRSLFMGACQGAGILGVLVLGVLIAYAADILTVDKDGVVRLRIASNGNVGVGTSADAGSRLEVRGSGTTNATSALNVTDSAGASRLFVRDDGNVGVGTNDPGSTLDINGRLRIGEGPTLTLDSAGEITVTHSFHTIDTFGGAATDMLVRINGGNIGDILLLRTMTSTRVITVQDNVNQRIGGDFTLDNGVDFVFLVKRGAAAWSLLSKANNL